MKLKLIYSNFNKETGKSTVIVADKYKRYTGYAQLHPEDQEYVSTFMGCVLAEYRAYIKALKEKRNRLKTEFKAIKNLIKDIEYKYHNNNLPKEIIHIFNLKKRDYTKELQEVNNEIREISIAINERVAYRDKIIKINKNK